MQKWHHSGKCRHKSSRWVSKSGNTQASADPLHTQRKRETFKAVPYIEKCGILDNSAFFSRHFNELEGEECVICS